MINGLAAVASAARDNDQVCECHKNAALRQGAAKPDTTIGEAGTRPARIDSCKLSCLAACAENSIVC